MGISISGHECQALIRHSWHSWQRLACRDIGTNKGRWSKRVSPDVVTRLPAATVGAPIDW